MKRILTILASFCLLFLTACEDATEIFNPESDYAYKQKQFSTLAGQFDYIWTGLNNSYVFWYADSTDWDAVREEYLPKFQKLDELGQKGIEVKDDTIKSLISKISMSLLDKHLEISMSNPYAENPVALQTSSFEFDEISTIVEVLMLIDYRINLYKQCNTSNVEEDGVNLSCVIDDSIVYLHTMHYYYTIPNHLQLSPKYISVFDNFFSNIRALSSQQKLKGIIIDNRSNYGGNIGDLNLFVQTFSSNDIVVARQRSKIGFGKYDYSHWMPYIISSDPTKYIEINNAPIVVLQNGRSASAGERVGHALSLLPNTHLIGERTFGAYSPVVEGSMESDGRQINSYDYFHSGSFNVDSLDYCIKKYGGAAAVRTAFSCHELKNRHTGKFEQREGIGIDPDEYVKLDTVRLSNFNGDNQLEAALNYIRKKNQ